VSKRDIAALSRNHCNKGKATILFVFIVQTPVAAKRSLTTALSVTKKCFMANSCRRHQRKNAFFSVQSARYFCPILTNFQSSQADFHVTPRYNVTVKSVQWEHRWYLRKDRQRVRNDQTSKRFTWFCGSVCQNGHRYTEIEKCFCAMNRST